MTEIRYYRAEPPPAGPPRRRRRAWPAVVLFVVFAAALVIVLMAVPWFGHLGLPWPGSHAPGGPTPGAAASGIVIDGAGQAPHAGKVLVRFSSRSGQPVVARWRVDGGPWHKGTIAFVRAPADHANDGAHVMEVQAVGGGAVVKYTVNVDTTPPRIAGVSVSPELISGPKSLTLTFDVPAGQTGVTVAWTVVDTLGKAVGERGAAHAAAGPETVDWAARSAAGGALFPGTYRLQVTARDAAGNETTATAAFASDAPVPAELIRSLPKAGNLVALTFDGGSGYAWRHIMLALDKVHAKGSFFCTGVSVDHYPEVAREAVALGMTIGNHSFDHPDFRTIGYDEARRQLLDNAQAWWKACGASPTPFFRPPYGSYNDTTLKAAGSVGYPFVVNWDVDTGDWTGAPPAEIARRAVAGAKPGSIICMHTLWTTQKAIPAMVAGLRAKGLEPVGLDQLFRAAGLL